MLCCCSAAQACPTLCDPMDCSMSGIPVLLEFVQVHVYCISDAIQPSHPLTPSSPPALNLSQHQGLFQWVICLHQQVISPSSEYSGLISLKIDWFDLLAVQGTFRSLLQHHSWKAINSLAFCLLYGPSLKTICDHWEGRPEPWLYGPLSAE